MANTIVSVTELANQAVDYLERQRGLANTLWTDAVSQSVAMRKGETVNVAAPPSFTAASYNGTSYTTQDINQSTVAVTLNKDYVVPVSISQREAGASANDIEAAVVVPAMDSLLKQMDTDVITEFANFSTTDVPESVGSMTIAQLELGMTTLLGADVPGSNLHCAISHLDASSMRQQAGVYSQEINSLNNNRSTNVAPYAGIDIFGTSAIASSGTDVSNWLYHEQSATIAMRPLNIPQGPGVEIGVADYKGMAITVTKQWNSATQAFEWVFRALYGVKVLNAVAGIEILTDGSGD